MAVSEMATTAPASVTATEQVTFGCTLVSTIVGVLSLLVAGIDLVFK
jgi:hypothetical protein